MYDTFDRYYTPKDFLISGFIIKKLREKLKIKFNDFCKRGGLSPATLSSIEKVNRKIISMKTMFKILDGFNNTRKGKRKKIITSTDISAGYYFTRDPLLIDLDNSDHMKITVYLNPAIHRGVDGYARKYKCTKNKAISSILKQVFHIDKPDLDFNYTVEKAEREKWRGV